MTHYASPKSNPSHNSKAPEGLLYSIEGKKLVLYSDTIQLPHICIISGETDKLKQRTFTFTRTSSLDIFFILPASILILLFVVILSNPNWPFHPLANLGLLIGIGALFYILWKKSKQQQRKAQLTYFIHSDVLMKKNFRRVIVVLGLCIPILYFGGLFSVFKSFYLLGIFFLPNDPIKSGGLHEGHLTVTGFSESFLKQLSPFPEKIPSHPP